MARGTEQTWVFNKMKLQLARHVCTLLDEVASARNGDRFFLSKRLKENFIC
jgi:hypothetical protein